MSPTTAGPSTSSSGVAPLNSDDDVQMGDFNGDAPATSSTTTITAAAADGAIEVDDNDDEQGSDAPEDEYEIEYIVSHFQDNNASGQLSYFVKWKGYPDSENSWVYDSDMGGAQEMITEYWAKVPEKRLKKMGTKGGKKGKRQSSVSASSPAAKASSSSLGASGRLSSRRESSLLAHEASNRKSSRRADALAPTQPPAPDDAIIDVETDPALQRIRSDPSLSDEQRELLEAQHLHAVKLDRLRKRYARIPDWDPIVKRVEAVEKMSDNKLRVFVHFESGDRLAFESLVAHHRCPLKLLQFYEANLRFKKRDEEEERVELMRGEEVMRELDKYTAQQEQVNGEGEGVNVDGEQVEGVEREKELETVDATMADGDGADAADGVASTVDSYPQVEAQQSQPNEEQTETQTQTEPQDAPAPPTTTAATIDEPPAAPTLPPTEP